MEWETRNEGMGNKKRGYEEAGDKCAPTLRDRAVIHIKFDVIYDRSCQLNEYMHVLGLGLSLYMYYAFEQFPIRKLPLLCFHICLLCS